MHSAMVFQSRYKPGDLLQHQWITAQAPALQVHISTATEIRANSINATGHHLSRLNATVMELYVSYKIFEQIIYNNQQQTTTTTPLSRHSQHPSPPAKSPGLN